MPPNLSRSSPSVIDYRRNWIISACAHRVNSRALYAYIRECAYNIEPHPVTGCPCDEGRLFYGSLQATHPLILSVRVTPSLEALKVTMFILRESMLRNCSTEYATVCSSPGAARSTLPRYTRLQAVCVCVVTLITMLKLKLMSKNEVFLTNLESIHVRTYCTYSI